jgi:aminoglycoside phosphotransferase (APT) family kinase protein
MHPEAVDALTGRILAGSHPCHGDISTSNVMVVGGNRVALVDAEALDRASMAWDLGHALTLATRLKIPLATWREALLSTTDLPRNVIDDADLVWACLSVRSNDDPASYSEALAHLRAAN